MAQKGYNYTRKRRGKGKVMVATMTYVCDECKKIFSSKNGLEYHADTNVCIKVAIFAEEDGVAKKKSPQRRN